MNKAFRVLTLSVFMLIMLFQFQNCGQASVPTTKSEDLSVACTEADCISPDESLLAVKPNLFSGEINITAAITEFNVGGDCNEGAYPANRIRWELQNQSGATVRHSGMKVAGGATADSQCVNGRFLLYVNLAAIGSEDPNNRTGLLNGASRQPYNLIIKIEGQEVAGGPLSTNTLSGRTVIPLIPK